MAGRRLLVATYHFPPDPSVGGRRWDAMTYWLRDLGHEVTVLSTSAWGVPDGDEDGVRRTGDLVTNSALRRILARPSLPVPGREMPVQKPPSRLLGDVVVPDAYLLSWMLGAAPVARRLVRDRRIECMITSGPPHSAHLLGLMLGSLRPPWIADFRDGWRYEMLRPPWPLRIQDRLDARLEQRVAQTAEALIGVTAPIAADFARRLGVSAEHVPNGWDPRADELDGRSAGPVLDGDLVNIVHAGQLSGPRGRDPRPVFEAIELLRSEHPHARIRLILAGRLDIGEQALLARLPDDGSIVHVGHLERREVFALERRADALLLLTSTGHASQATGKLFEYLTAGKPIIALAEGNEAARIVTETGTGITVPPDSPTEIADALLAAADGRLQRDYAPRNLDRYIYPAPARELAAVVERAIAVREAV
jgi:glycosyltransferase involved in cell wall biosynthesis